MKRKLLLFNALALLFCLQIKAQAFTENFDNITTLAGSGWSLQNASVAVGSTGWFQGTNVAGGGPFDSYNGAPNSYIGANYNNTGSTGTISNWLLTPNRTFRNGDVVTFYTRKVAPDSYADRLQVRLSTNGASTSVGTGSAVGDFTTLLLSINPTLVLGVYPTTWTQYTITISGLPAPTSGRMAFRYFVTGAGFSGTSSDYIGIDNITYTPYVCPSFTLTAGGALSGGIKGTAYSSSLTQTGALGAPNYAVTAGALPSGLTLSASGTISGTPTAAGTFNFTVTVSDASGCSGSQSYSITVVSCDVNLPGSLPDYESQCAVALSNLTIPTITDTCGNTIIPTTDAVFPITAQGTTTITWFYLDIYGNTQTLTQDIQIDDFTEPTPDVAVLADITASCEVIETDVTAPTATDNCNGTVTVTSDAVFPITVQGTTTITWTYTDAVGNAATQTQDVIIADFIEPTPDLALLPDVIAQCEVLATDVTAPTATDNCSGTVTVTNDAVFPITTQGTTQITWTYTDANGNSDTQTQNIVITDTTAPVADVAVLADITAQCEVLEADVTPPTATDNCSGTVTVTSNAVFPIAAQGTTEIIWTYTDANGNTETQTQEVIINDTTAPTPDAAALADITASCEVLATDVTAPTATDNCSGTVTVTSDAIFPITAQGTTVIIWTYTDAHGNSETQPQDVVIADFTAPTPDAAVLTDIVAECQVLEADVAVPTATDNCSGVVTVTSDAVFPITAQGTTVITWTYTDAHGNTETQTQDVVVVDNTDPTVTLTNISVAVDVNGNATVTPLQLHNGTAADNCGIASVTVAPNTFTCSDLGSHIVTVTVTDIHGNTITEDATVTVTDPDNFCMLAVAHNVGTAFALYPNPTGNMLYIQPANNETLRSVTVYSISGQAVMTTSYNNKVLEKYSISLDALAEGTYLLRLETPTGTYTKRVIKQNK